MKKKPASHLMLSALGLKDFDEFYFGIFVGFYCPLFYCPGLAGGA